MYGEAQGWKTTAWLMMKKKKILMVVVMTMLGGKRTFARRRGGILYTANTKGAKLKCNSASVASEKPRVACARVVILFESATAL